jgi:hypothetical protein
LEDLVARIDAPLLDTTHIWFFHQLIFNTPQLAQFIARTPNIQPPVKACMDFSDHNVMVSSPGPRTFFKKFVSGIICSPSDWQLSSVAQVCSSSLPEVFIPTVEHLYIIKGVYSLLPRWQDDIESSQWLEVLQPFASVKYLYLADFARRIAPALQELAGEEVLPSLQNIFLASFYYTPDREAIGKFVAARQLAGHHIAFSHWDTTKDE